MQRRTLCCPLQMVQYLSQVQRSSGRLHCMQTVGACIRPSGKTVPEPWRRGKAKVGEDTPSRLPPLLSTPGTPSWPVSCGHTNRLERWPLDAVEVAAGVLASIGIGGRPYGRVDDRGDRDSGFLVRDFLLSRDSAGGSFGKSESCNTGSA